MSSTIEEKKDIVPVTTTPPVGAPPVAPAPKDNGFLGLGIDLNNPVYAFGALVAGVAVGLTGLTLYNRFMTPKATPVNPPSTTPPIAPPIVTVPTPDELRMKQRAPSVENRRRTAEEEYIESIRLNGIIEQQNRNLSQYNIHSSNFYDQMYNVPPAKHTFPPIGSDDDDDAVTDVFDDFAPEYLNYRPQAEYRDQQIRERPIEQKPHKMTAVVDRNPPPKIEEPAKVEDTQAVSPEEIDSYDHVDIKAIPPEFVNVGNRPEPFENIQPVDNQSSDYDLDNMEIDEDTLKVLETNALASISSAQPPKK